MKSTFGENVLFPKSSPRPERRLFRANSYVIFVSFETPFVWVTNGGGDFFVIGKLVTPCFIPLTTYLHPEFIPGVMRGKYRMLMFPPKRKCYLPQYYPRREPSFLPIPHQPSSHPSDVLRPPSAQSGLVRPAEVRNPPNGGQALRLEHGCVLRGQRGGLLEPLPTGGNHPQQGRALSGEHPKVQPRPKVQQVGFITRRVGNSDLFSARLLLQTFLTSVDLA